MKRQVPVEQHAGLHMADHAAVGRAHRRRSQQHHGALFGGRVGRCRVASGHQRHWHTRGQRRRQQRKLSGSSISMLALRRRVRRQVGAAGAVADGAGVGDEQRPSTLAG